MRKFHLHLTRNLTSGSEYDAEYPNLSASALVKLTLELAQAHMTSSMVLTISHTEVEPSRSKAKHPAPFAKTKAGQRRRAERNFTAQGAYDDLWGPPLENTMDWEQ